MAPLSVLVQRVAHWALPVAPFAPLPPEALTAAVDEADLIDPQWQPPALTATSTAPPPAPLTLTAASRPQRPPQMPLSQQAPVKTEWSDRAWSYYRASGEARQAVDWVAGGISRFRLYIGEAKTDGSGDPEPMDDPGVAGDVLAELFDGPMGQQEVLRKLATNLLVPGEAWLVGYPKPDDPLARPGDQAPAPLPEQRRAGRRPTGWNSYGFDDTDRQGPAGRTPFDVDKGTADGETSWTVVSRKEWQEMDSGRLRIKLPEDPRRSVDHWVEFESGQVVLVPVYQPDPEDSSRATSAFEAALAIFEELDGLNRRVGADITSRLAGNGVAVVSENATMPDQGAQQGAGVNAMNSSSFLATLLQAIGTAIQHPGSAAAVAPIFLQVPDEAFQGMGPLKHITFATPFDAQVPVLREDARRRVAVVMDIPASIVNGIEDLNHWSAWAVSDDAIRSHLGPLAALICSTITRKVLWPVLRAAGVEDWKKFVIWWDASELVLRPDRSTEALAAHAAGVISDKALRRTLAFDEEDAPSPEEKARVAVEAARLRIEQGGQPPAEEGRPVDQGGQPTPGDRPNAPSQQQSDQRADRRYRQGPTGSGGAPRPSAPAAA